MAVGILVSIRISRAEHLWRLLVLVLTEFWSLGFWGLDRLRLLLHLVLSILFFRLASGDFFGIGVKWRGFFYLKSRDYFGGVLDELL